MRVAGRCRGHQSCSDSGQGRRVELGGEGQKGGGTAGDFGCWVLFSVSGRIYRLDTEALTSAPAKLLVQRQRDPSPPCAVFRGKGTNLLFLWGISGTCPVSGGYSISHLATTVPMGSIGLGCPTPVLVRRLPTTT